MVPKKQTVVARSSAESEYRAIAQATAEITRLQHLPQKPNLLPSTPIVLWSDNMSAISLASNPVFHSHTKYIQLDVHFIRDKVLVKTL